MSLLKQCLLWAVFTLSFYSFLCASECLSLIWSDMLICNLLHYAYQRLIPFGEGNQFIYVHATSTTTCPVQAMRNYHDIVTAKQQHDLVFSASTIEPLSRSQLIAILR